MEVLGGSYLKFFVSRQKEVERVSMDFSLCRHDFGFLVHQKRAGDGLVSLRANCVTSISAAVSAQTDLESEEIQTLNSDQPKTVRVRFKLHRYCAFGQQFLVVGDDPSLGSWDPSDGIPLNWSEGHVWTARVDIPSSKVINYKFILKETAATVSWQPGPDRVLETWDTAKTISVTEDWDIPESQIVDEEEQVDGNGHTGIHSDKPPTLMVAENIAVDLEEMDLKNGRGLVMDVEGPVLVPGLSTEAEMEASTFFDEIEDSTDPNQKNISIVEDTTTESDETETANKPEIWPSAASLHYAETSELMVVGGRSRFNPKKTMISNILDRDVQWVKQTLDKFLANLGLLQLS